eukprot:CAMPEP_0174281430 /NCGR_PEP_ID=MMETSP0809-20121228/1823_1 /TAXON_ID=73025 ORGANISM="Eutreptiella gymnastica-like, Strain CCMP1594" /NCGR_SAMPLE_ID=MMETSP0809 /ASSEMBLY_ACC=CAM_ASM_000658 /LENGTH=113 /DNA_ID=CAMNT_0015374999 /DNA_START=690 /DNA_END=1031 /DNA_ORIENTATION=+
MSSNGSTEHLMVWPVGSLAIYAAIPDILALAAKHEGAFRGTRLGAAAVALSRVLLESHSTGITTDGLSKLDRRITALLGAAERDYRVHQNEVLICVSKTLRGDLKLHGLFRAC